MKQVAHLIFAVLVFFQLYFTIVSSNGDEETSTQAAHNAAPNSEGSQPPAHDYAGGSGSSGTETTGNKGGGFSQLFFQGTQDKVKEQISIFREQAEKVGASVFQGFVTAFTSGGKS